jgi:hypothetical protein
MGLPSLGAVMWNTRPAPRPQRRRPAACAAVLAAGAMAASVLSGCTTLADRRVNVLCVPPAGRVETGVVLMAQAVPGAEYIPCVKLYPAGWSLASLRASRGQAVMLFDSDRGGMGALRVTFAPRCRPAGTSIPPDVLGADGLRVRNERVRQFNQKFSPTYHATRYYTFNGGCMIFELQVNAGTQATLTTDAAIMVNLVSRRALALQVAAAGFHL